MGKDGNNLNFKELDSSSQNDDSFAQNNLAKNMNSLMDLRNDTHSKNFSLNSKDMKLSPERKQDEDNTSVQTL